MQEATYLKPNLQPISYPLWGGKHLFLKLTFLDMLILIFFLKEGFRIHFSLKRKQCTHL